MRASRGANQTIAAMWIVGITVFVLTLGFWFGDDIHRIELVELAILGGWVATSLGGALYINGRIP